MTKVDATNMAPGCGWKRLEALAYNTKTGINQPMHTHPPKFPPIRH